MGFCIDFYCHMFHSMQIKIKNVRKVSTFNLRDNGIWLGYKYIRYQAI